MSDLLFQNLSTVQSDKNASPSTIVVSGAGSTIAPTTFLTYVTGSAANVETITPPVTGSHMLAIVFSTGAAMVTTGNIATPAPTPVTDVPALFIYNPITGLYHVKI